MVGICTNELTKVKESNNTVRLLLAVSAVAILGGTRTSISIDICIGDVVEGAEKSIEFLGLKAKPLFEASVALQVYPLEYIFAEKLETVIYRGVANSRMKDFFDLWFLIGGSNLDFDKTRQAVANTFKNRRTIIQLITPIIGMDDQAKRNWNSFVRGLDSTLKASLPTELTEICLTIDLWLQDNNYLAVSY